MAALDDKHAQYNMNYLLSGGGFRDDKQSSIKIEIPQQPVIGQVFRLALVARDAFGNLVKRGRARVELDIEEPPIIAGSDQDHILAPKLECEVIDSDDGRYVLALTCVRPGEHTLTVRLEREEVIGSPMSFVAEPAKVRKSCLLYTSPSPRDRQKSRMPSSA